MGVQLELDGTKLVVDTAADIRWRWIFIGTAVVSSSSCCVHFSENHEERLRAEVYSAGYRRFTTVKQKLFLIALLVIAVAWPFMVSRGTVDIATLTMILYHPRSGS